jgi:hypothetical protein
VRAVAVVVQETLTTLQTQLVVLVAVDKELLETQVLTRLVLELSILVLVVVAVVETTLVLLEQLLVVVVLE